MDGADTVHPFFRGKRSTKVDSKQIGGDQRTSLELVFPDIATIVGVVDISVEAAVGSITTCGLAHGGGFSFEENKLNIPLYAYNPTGGTVIVTATVIGY